MPSAAAADVAAAAAAADVAAAATADVAQYVAPMTSRTTISVEIC